MNIENITKGYKLIHSNNDKNIYENEKYIVKIASKCSQKIFDLPQEIKMLQIFSEMIDTPRVVQFGIDENFYFIFFKKNTDILVDLFDFLNSHRNLSNDIIKKIFTKVLKDILILWNNGYVHGDIKDENILINPKTYETFLIDFDNSQKIQDPYISSGCTRIYMPPEYIKNQKSTCERCTIWTLGCLFYALCEGDIPWQTEKEILENKLTFTKTHSEYKFIIEKMLCENNLNLKELYFLISTL